MKIKLIPGEVVTLTAHATAEIEIPSNVAVEKSGGYTTTFTVGAGGSGGGGGASSSDSTSATGGAGGSYVR